VVSSNIYRAPQIKLKRTRITPTTIAQTGVNPVTGQYLSAEQRKSIFKRTTVSSKNVFSRPGALVKVGQPGALTRQDDGSGKGISFNILFARVVAVEKQVAFLAKALDKEAELEKKARKEYEKEQLQEEERDRRSVKEKNLEKGIFKALISPVQAVAGKAQSVLGNLIKFFGILLAGWLTNQGLRAFQARKEGNEQEFEGIKNEIIKTLAIIGGIFLALNGGIGIILGIIPKIIGAIGFLGKGILSLAGAAIKSITGVAGGAVLGKVALGVGGIGLALGAGFLTTKGSVDLIRNVVTGGKTFREAHDKANSKRQAAGVSARGRALGRRGSRLVETNTELTPEQKKAFEEWKKEKRRLDDLRDAMNAEIKAEVAKVKKSGVKKTGRNKVQKYFTSEDNAKKNEIRFNIRQKYELAVGDPKATAASVKSIKVEDPNITPTTTSAEENTFVEGKKYNTGDVVIKNGKKLKFDGFGWSEVGGVRSQNLNLKVPKESSPFPARTEAKISATPPSMNIPGPVSGGGNTTVIYKKVGGAGRGAGDQSLKSGSATDVPLIASANPSNFYTMYSQIVYNVVN